MYCSLRSLASREQPLGNFLCLPPWFDIGPRERASSRVGQGETYQADKQAVLRVVNLILLFETLLHATVQVEKVKLGQAGCGEIHQPTSLRFFYSLSLTNTHTFISSYPLLSLSLSHTLTFFINVGTKNSFESSIIANHLSVGAVS